MKAPEDPRVSEETPGARDCARSVGWLRNVTVLWLRVVYPKPFFGSLRRDDERHVENRLNLAMVAHKHRVVTFEETLARLVELPSPYFGLALCPFPKILWQQTLRATCK